MLIATGPADAPASALTVFHLTEKEKFSNSSQRWLRSILVLSAALLVAFLRMASASEPGVSQAFHFDPGTRVFRIDGGEITYAFGINSRGELESLYWGGRLLPDDPLPAQSYSPIFETESGSSAQEFAGWGGGIYVEPALKISFPDGNRDLILHYVSHVVAADALEVILKDISREVFVTLLYTVDAETGVIGRSAVIQNKTESPMTIEQAAAGSFNLPVGDHYELNYLTGDWASDFNLRHQEIAPGKTVLESRRGSTSQQNNPWFAIERMRSNGEDHGAVWFGALAWSGSWSMAIEQDQAHRVRVTAGFNPFDFGYKLAPGQELRTPVFYGGFTEDGLGGASRLMHRFELTRVLPGAPEPKLRRVLYNSWEATKFDVDEAGQEALAEKAAGIGAERFVMDDGWFGERKNDTAGLGDWYVNPRKFPHGLKPLIDKVHALGMDFGLWVEPEAVNPDSDLYRRHPDWVLNFPGRPRTEVRHQLVLNLARKDVRDYVFHALDKLLSENDIAFLKWDYNRNWSEPGWPDVAPDEQKKVYVDQIQALYGILRDIRAKHPGLEIEGCAGGGGRVDLGMMGYVDQFWPSDNTDPFSRLTIQDGYAYAYTPATMMDWVTDSPNDIDGRTTSLDYRFLVAMQGSLGIGANLAKWTPGELAEAKQWVAEYKLIRETVQRGSLFRLISPQGDSEYAATETVSLDRGQAVVFAFLHSSQIHREPYPTLYLRGLDPQRIYELRALGDAAPSFAPPKASGSYWMRRGISPRLRGDFKAEAFVLTRVGQ
jgi:alpha-galactosidase